MKLSIIIPIYNAENTLVRCLESVTTQQYGNYEIILVEDGATDNSPRICDDWAKNNQDIKVIHKQNGGLSDARNVGIKASTGTHVTFIDADDYISPNTFCSLMEYAYKHPECDIIEYPAIIQEGATCEKVLSFESRSYNNISKYWIETKGYTHAYAWNKIFQKRLFDNVVFPVGKVFEDIYTIPKLLTKATCIATLNQGLYHYCYNENSITAKANGNDWRMLLDAHMQVLSMSAFATDNDDYHLHLLNIQLFTNELTGDKPIIPIHKFHKIKSIKTIIVNIIGISNLCILNRIYRTFRKRR